ncbi:hypothetical protein M406DRAFT_343373 [Cryphonectria parasitica EP155]|uniref:SEC7 domain-containing protein n=1 Tax=Cryphonectria parasitica (strain ATCC 38755 / EP155) TaxID=660469 RepID=A0A9P4XSN6_CRYP1|nr:uncharacterized protein M406DRAFT_343373 [Cryphonectria parasitica EP155]KAF3760231.1 hypothetical protein M406DRAFT_343373 [Cryphonectria parasitica EP155]
MPFLRNKRGNLASQSELRRSTVLPDEFSLGPGDPVLRTVTSNIDLPTLRLSPSHLDADVGAAADAAAAAALNGSTPSIPAPPVTPPHDNRPDSPPIQDENTKHKRFSMLRFRNASDSQLSARAKKQAHAHADESAPPLPRAPPEIITTAPTVDFHTVPRKQSRMFARLTRRSGEELRTEQAPAAQVLSKKDRRKSYVPGAYSTGKKSISIEEPDVQRPKSSNAHPGHIRSDEPPPPLPLPGSRLSESSRSEESSAGRAYTNTPTSTSNSSSTNNFFRLRRKPKQPEPLFPFAHLQRQRSHDQSASSNPSLTPSTPARQSTSSTASAFSTQHTPVPRTSTAGDGVTTPPAVSPGRGVYQKQNASPATALFRPLSRNSGTSSPTRPHLNLRGRSSTMSSLGRESLDDRLGPPQSRASTSTTGRKSFGDLLGISRLRGPESARQGNGTPATPGSNTSKDNSLNIQRESVVLPEKREDENPGRYLERLEDIASRSMIAAAIAKSADAFHLAVLRSFMRRFGFFGDPMDMAIRKLLMSAELPKETQHIDRFLQAFANRYHECNPGIYANPEQAYFIAFSLLILHTDVFNKNNKHKMQKHDYIKNTKGEGIADEVLEVFYDNITYTPFIHVEDELDITGDRASSHKSSKKKSVLPIPTAPEAALKKAAKEPIDPYTIILDNRLDILRPNFKDVMHLDDHFNYVGTAPSLNLKELQKTFFRTGILQIVSARSRPDAFMSEKTATNPAEAQPGVVDIKVTKVGLLWRKDAKKKKTRSPWQEWGAILTGAQLYFFRNTAWVKHLMHQYESHIKQGHDGIPIIFKPPLESFKPDALMSTDGAVALLDSTYRKHKHAFVYVRHGGLEEVLLADDEDEMNDWLAKLNYAAAFRTNGVRMRGVMNGTYDGQGRRALKKDTEAVQTPSGEVMIARAKVDQQMANDILFARREMMLHKVAEANEKLQEEEKKLDGQLRNARHLQLLAPIQPKTRDSMLMAAARMAAQLKWTRVEIWRLKCHRDIMLLDLEEERQMLGLPAGPISEAVSPTKPALGREVSKTSKASSGTVMPSPLVPVAANSQRGQAAEAAEASSDDESVDNETFQTPPTSAGQPPLHKHQNSWELPSHNHESTRKASVSSAKSSRQSIPVTPPRTAATSSSAPEHAATDDAHPEEDANERDLLEKTGLLGKEITLSPENVDKTRTQDSEQTPEYGPHSNSLDKDKSDKNKIRRSLQRTLREGAGHLSHARSRKGKEPAASSVTDETEAETLTRAAGPFVVHGKKASVITFGSELQSLSPDERLRARKSSQMEDTIINGDVPEETTASCGSGSGNGDFRVFLLSGPKSAPAEHRSSAASASTATARSFRELHRKYSSAAARHSTSAGNLALSLVVPGDEDSDAAVSFSDGRRSPLPVEEVEEEEEEIPEDPRPEAEKLDGEEKGDDQAEEPIESATIKPARETLFFTPEPPASPKAEPSGAEESREGVPSPTVPVSA